MTGLVLKSFGSCVYACGLWLSSLDGVTQIEVLIHIIKPTVNKCLNWADA